MTKESGGRAVCFSLPVVEKYERIPKIEITSKQSLFFTIETRKIEKKISIFLRMLHTEPRNGL